MPIKHKPMKRAKKIELLRKRDGPGCFYKFPGCKAPDYITDEQATFDHFHPQCRGGSWDLVNLRLACRHCNNRKADRVPEIDGSIPPPPPRQQRRAVKRADRPELCTICHSARLLRDGETCFACGRGALPQHRSHYYKRKCWDCDHSQTWCVACVLLTPEEKHSMVASKYAALLVGEIKTQAG